GCLSGLLNGSTGLAGPPAVIFYFSSEGAAARGRASLIAFFVATDVFALFLARAGGLLDAQATVLALYALPFVALGIWLGHRRFIATEPETFRRVVLWILAGLGLAGLVLAAVRYSAAT
ncbi:MAG TPA: TSUP family transporter, partial [Methylomirabilota bacterium]|nr:TSUP family transporter [Methylomirabilota bacterium]